MPEFEDYHRTVIGYHGTRKSTALKLVQGLEKFQPSRNDDDWLGHGIYFWEYAPKQARLWAEQRRINQNWDDDVAVVASMIRLGNCWDFLEPLHLEELYELYMDFEEKMKAANMSIKSNRNSQKFLDCSVFEYAYKELAKGDNSYVVDTCRAVFIPSGTSNTGKRSTRLWNRSSLYWNAHIQLCVRNSKCILGTWLVDA